MIPARYSIDIILRLMNSKKSARRWVPGARHQNASKILYFSQEEKEQLKQKAPEA